VRSADSWLESIRSYNTDLKSLLELHQDYRRIKSLPCGATSQARLIAALGDDRTRYGSAEELVSATGIAPLITQSGKMRYISCRWACSKFLGQAFHEFAGISINRSRWSKADYQQQLGRGKSPNMAKRALADGFASSIAAANR
jgi:transposase